jgi:cytochrome P450
MASDDTRARLRELDLFENCGDAELDRLAEAVGPEVGVPAGTVLFREGDAARDCTVILEGEADVLVAGRYVGSAGPGESVGEMGLLDDAPRSATVVARTPLRARVIDAAAFDALLDDAPSVSRALLRQLSRRLRALDQTLARLAALAGETTVAVGAPAAPAAPPPPARLALDPAAPGYFADPYAHYAALREHAPVHRDPVLGTWLLTRYDDVLRLTRDREQSVELARAAGCPAVDRERARLARMDGRGSQMMLRRDPPDHTRMRRIVYRRFTPKEIKKLRPRLQQIVDERLERLAEKGEADLIADFAFPLPFQVISEMLGMPPGDEGLLRGWSEAITKTLDPVITPEQEDAAVAASRAMSEYLLRAIVARGTRPGEDMLTELIDARDEGGALSEAELADQVQLLFIAGHETTVNLIGNGLLALLRQRDQLERLRRDPALDANAIEELLRFDSPAQFTRRVALQDLEYGGRRIPAGSLVLACLGAANRDPARWGEMADRVDVARAGAHEHLSFGGGVHHCVGASLARMEGQVALGSLLRRFARIDLAGEPVHAARMSLRGLAKLPLVVGV